LRWFSLRESAERRWHAARPSQQSQLDCGPGTVFGVAPHPLNAERLLSAGEDGVLRCWDAVSGAAVSALDLGSGGLFHVHAWREAEAGPGRVAAAGFNGYITLLFGFSADAMEVGNERCCVLASHAAPVVRRVATPSRKLRWSDSLPAPAAAAPC